MAEIFASSSVVLVGNTNSTIVYCQYLSSLGNFLTVRDTTGTLRSTNAILLSSLSGATFEGNIGNLKIVDPYGFVTFNIRKNYIFSVGNSLAFPLGQYAASNVDVIDATNLSVLSTLKFIDEANQSTNVLFLSSQNLVLNNSIIGQITEFDLISTIDELGSLGYLSSIEVPEIVVKPPMWLAGGYSSNTALSVFTPPGSGSSPTGTIQYSYDGFQWMNADGGFTVNCTGIAYGNGVFVAVGTNWDNAGPGGYFSTNTGYHQWSYDGIHWSNAITPSYFQGQYERLGVTFNNGLFHSFGKAPFGGENTILWSQDGSNWKTSMTSVFPSPFGLPAQCSGVAFGAGVWVAAGTLPTDTEPQRALVWSRDGSNWSNAETVAWTVRSIGGPNFAIVNDVSYDGVMFVATQQQGTNPSSSNICYSYDGKNWTSDGISNGNWNNQAYTLGNNFADEWVLTTKQNGARVLTSEDGGFMWDNNTNLANCNALIAGANTQNSRPYFDGEKWYLGIEQSYTNTINTQNMFYSYDLLTWTNSNISSGFIRAGFPQTFYYFPGEYNYLQAMYSTNRITGTVSNLNTNTYTAQFILTNSITAKTATVTTGTASFTSTGLTVETINNITNHYVQFVSAGNVNAITTGFISSLSSSYISTTVLTTTSTTVHTLDTPFLAPNLLITSNLNVSTIYTKLGYQAGAFNQSPNTVAIGYRSGEINQAENSIAIGVNAGNSNQGSNSIAIGADAGRSNQSPNAIAMGFWAGRENQSTNTIILNATGGPLNSIRSNAFYVAPIQEETSLSGLGGTIQNLLYNNTTKEIYTGNAQISTFSTLFVSTLGVNMNLSDYNLSVLGGAQISTNGSVYIGPSTIQNGVAFGANYEPGQTNVFFTATKGPQNKKGWFDFYAGVNNNTNVGASNLTLTIANSSIGINVSTPQFTVDVYDRVNVISTISVPTAFISSINGYQYNSTISSFSTLIASTIYVQNSTLASSIFTSNVTTNILLVNGTTTMRYPPKQQLWVAVGEASPSAATIQYSTDGSNWSSSASGGFTNIGSKVAWNGKMWVAVGNGSSSENIKYSFDGSNWNNLVSGGFNGSPYNIGWNEKMWIAVGDGGSPNASIKYSLDGSNWNNISSGGFGSYGVAVAWNGTLWVAMGYGSGSLSIKYSYDGSNWYDSSSSGFTSTYGGIAWNGFMWVAVGNADTENARIQYSYDGINWKNSAGGGPNNGARGVAWNGYMWVVVGFSSIFSGIVYSYNGINWSNSFNGFSGGGNAIAWDGRMWIATGNMGSALTSVKYSFNGINWININSGGFAIGNGIAYSTTVYPDLEMNNFHIYSQSQPTYVSSINQIFTTVSTIVVNNTLYIDQNSNSIGINRGFTQHTVDVIGNVRATSTIIAFQGVFNESGTAYTTSDSNLKENIIDANLQTCYNTVKQLPLHRYTFNEQFIDTKIDKHQLGFIAQEVQTQFPHAVVTMYDKYRDIDVLHLNTDQILMAHYGTTKVLLEEIRRQSTFISQLEYYINQLENQVSTVKYTSNF
jgi:hypothetical protein